MSPSFPFLTGMVPPLIKDKLMERAKPQPIIEEERRPMVEEATRFPPSVGIGNLQQAFMQRGPLSGLSQFINQELAQENRGEVDEFIGEVGDMANQRFGVDLGSVGQRPMFRPELIRAVGTPIQGYKDGGAAFPDVTGPGGGPPDGKVTQADVLKLRGVELKEYGGPIGMQMGGDPMMAAGMPMPPQPAPPMPAPEQPPMPMEDQLDPNVVQSALAQAAGGIGDLDQAQNYEQVMNTMRGDQATVEERREELAGVVGPGDANQTPESVLTLVQPVMMLANVDQGIGQLAQQEMTQPMEGPMAGGIMSTVPEPPMMEAGGTAPVNFNKGGEVRPIQNFEPGGFVGFGDMRLSQLGVNLADPSQTEPLILNIVNQAKNQEQAQPGTGKNLINNFFEKRRDLYRQIGLGDPKARAAMAEDQKRMTRAQILFDIATTALAFAAPMEGERPGLSPAERLAMAARSTQLPEKIGARAQAQLQSEKEAAKEERAIDLAALQAAEAEATAARAASEARALAELKNKTKTTKPMYYEDKTGKKTFFDGNTQYGTFSKLQIEQGGAIFDVGTKPTTKSTKDFVTLQTPTGERSRLFDLNKETDLLEFREFEKNNPGSKPLKIATDTAPVDLEVKAAQKFGFTSVKELQEYKQQNPDGYQALMGDPNVITNKDYFTKFGLTIEQFKLLDDKVKRRLTEVDPETEVRVVDNQIIDITDIKNPKVVFGTKSLKTTTIKGQLIDFTDPDNVRVLFSDPDVKTTTVNGEVVDITDPANPKVIFGEKDRKTLTLKGEVIDITNPDDVKVIYGNKDKVLKIVKGQLVEVPEEGDPIPIFGERTPDTGTFENMLLNTGEMILVKKVGEDLYDTDGTKIDRAAERYKDALLISKDTAFDVSTTAKSQAQFKEQLLEAKGLQSDNELRNQILNPVGRLAGVLPTNQQERSQVMKITFDALRDARKGVGFYNKLKQTFSEYVGGVFPPLQDVFADEVQAGNFVTAANVLIRVALANSPRFAEGEQERLGAILPNAERLFANPENAVRKFIGVKKLLRQEKINVLEILAQETDTNIKRENKRQLYAINSALKMLETIPDVGFVNTEEFENTMEILQQRRQERGG
jgi:hypothetical protein